jgi:hypothetical protein
MRFSRYIAFAAVIFLGTAGVPVSAGWINELGRDLGVGWSDGYHAYEGCPDPRLRSQPWQRRSQRGGCPEESLVPFLTPAPAAREPAESLPPPKSSRATAPTRNTQLQISRPNY